MHPEVSLVFPHQLFASHPALDHKRPVYLVEEWLFFRQYPFHKKKLLLHRATMRAFADKLTRIGFQVHYVESTRGTSDVRNLVGALPADIKVIHVVDPVDDWLGRRLRNSCICRSIELKLYDNPQFLNKPSEVDAFFDRRKTYFQTDFYTWQRKQRKILVDTDGKPLGGKWTYDTDNRRKFPKNGAVPTIGLKQYERWAEEARQYVGQNFPGNPGALDGPDLFATTSQDAEDWLMDFLLQRFQQFGVYEDAIVAKESVLFHSVLTPMLNIGLLTPQQILDAALKVAGQQEIPLNSVEGFIRQIMGWREFIRILYVREGSRQRSRNYWGFQRRIPKSFWIGNTGILPLDQTIHKVLKTGYCHHIERLMVLGNFMLLCEFDPDEVYRWFMELFLDAYDWVMVPNVYGMSQYADGGLMTTKPYISGSNYLMKMSDYPKGDWQVIWDALFWRFLHVHRETFSGNPRWSMLIKTFDGMSAEKREGHLRAADQFLAELDQHS